MVWIETDEKSIKVDQIRQLQKDILIKQLNIIDLMDVVVSILTLQNTLISVNSVGFDEGLYYLTIGSSFVGFVINLLLVFMLKHKKTDI